MFPVCPWTTWAMSIEKVACLIFNRPCKNSNSTQFIQEFWTQRFCKLCRYLQWVYIDWVSFDFLFQNIILSHLQHDLLLKTNNWSWRSVLKFKISVLYFLTPKVDDVFDEQCEKMCKGKIFQLQSISNSIMCQSIFQESIQIFPLIWAALWIILSWGSSLSNF